MAIGKSFIRTLASGKRVRVKGRTIKAVLQNVATSSKTDKAFKQILESTVENKQLPRRAAFLSLLKGSAQDFIKNPVKAIKEGNARERLLRAATKAPTRKEVLRRGLQATKKAATSADMKVNTVGFIGSKLGQASGIPGAGLLGDYLGAAGARRALHDSDLLKLVKANLAKDDTYKKASKLEKLKMIGRESKRLKKAQSRFDDVAGDASGFVVGNGAASLPGAVPLQGAGVASATVPSIVKALKRARGGEKFGAALKDEITKPIRKGLQRERIARKKINRSLKRRLE